MSFSPSVSISKTCRRGRSEQTSVKFSEPPLARLLAAAHFSLSLKLPPWTPAEPSHTAEVLWSTYHGQSPQTSSGWQSGVKWLATQDKLSRYNLELLNLYTAKVGNQSHSIYWNMSLYLSFFSAATSLSLKRKAIKLGSVYSSPDSQRKLCIYVVTKMFCCKILPLMMVDFMSLSMHGLDIILPTAYPSFPLGERCAMGEGKLAIPLLSRTPRLEQWKPRTGNETEIPSVAPQPLLHPRWPLGHLLGLLTRISTHRDWLLLSADLFIMAMSAVGEEKYE